MKSFCCIALFSLLFVSCGASTGTSQDPVSDEGSISLPDVGVVLPQDSGVDAGIVADVGDVQEPIDSVSLESCGDGICNGIETPGSCQQDCPSVCGDTMCTGTESSMDCAEDCGSLCGDGVCNGAELPGSCISDCGRGGGSCAPVAEPEAVSSSPSDQVLEGSYESTAVDGFADDYIANPEGTFKVGIRRDWGGTIIFFGSSGDSPGLNTSNVIDAHDTGREVQVAFYDPERNMQGCAHNASCQSNPGGACPSQITFLGWNPVQGGNECNQGSGVEAVNYTKGTLISETNPVHWNPDWQLANCENSGCSSPATSALKSDVIYTQRLRFISPNVVEMEMEVENTGGIHHKPHPQEFPTLYASFGHQGTPNLNRIMNSDGQQVTGDGLDGNGFNYGDFNTEFGWATLQNQSLTYGVGLYYENRIKTFRAYWKDGVFNNFRSLFSFGLNPFGTVKARAYLILGSFDTVEALANGLDNGLGPFGVLDSPEAEDSQVGSTISVEGWVLDNKEVIDLEVLVDAQMVATLPLDIERPDVCDTYAGYEMCGDRKVGFKGSFSSANLSPCPHLLEVRASDSDGNTRVIARKRIFLGNSGPQTNCGDGLCQSDEDFTGCPEDCDAPTNETMVPVYRFFKGDGISDDHLFDTDPTPPPGFAFEGEMFTLFSEAGPGLTPLYQSFCASCFDHLQTINSGEGAPSYVGPVVLGYCATSPTGEASKELRRVFNEPKQDHFVTKDEQELSSLEALGYTLEGVLCYVP